MDLNWTDEQQALREMLRAMLDEYSNSELVRELEDDPKGYSEALWSQLQQLDLLGLTVAPEHGGLGMSSLDQVVLYEELGRALANTPHLVSVVFAGGVLARAGSEAQQAEWLPKVAKGESVLSVAWYEPQRSEKPEGVQLTAKPDGDGFRLSGTKIRVPYASSTDALVVLARTGEGEADIDLFLVPTDADGVDLTHTTVLSSECEYEVRFENVEVGSDARIGGAGTGWATVQEVLLDTQIAAAAYAAGGARKTLEMTIEYAQEREQFGRKIGSFQGLAHPIADITTEIEAMETMVHQAAWRRDQGEDCAPLIAMAKFCAGDVYKRATKVGQQVYGGIGFTRAIDVQLYTRRAKQLELTWNGPALGLEAIAAAELDGDPFVGIPSAL